MSEVLSQSQIDALLNAFQSGGNEEKPAEPEKKYRKYDFSRPRKFTKDRIKMLNGVFENYTRVLNNRLNALLRINCEIEVESIEEQRYFEFSNAISESDVMLAGTSGAIIVGFNVRPDNNAKDSAARMGVDMRMYRVIYDAINEIEAAMKGMLAPKFREVDLGRAEVRNVFRITGVGMVAGCYVLDGKMQRNAQMRLLRDNIVIYDGAIASLQRFKDSVKEVAAGYECGITFEKFQDIKEGDVIEAFLMEQIEV